MAAAKLNPTRRASFSHPLLIDRPKKICTVHVYTQRIHSTTQNNVLNNTESFGRVRAVPLFAGFTLAFALQLRKKHGKTSVRVAEECQLAR
jgi:hypothetical protein